MNLNADSCQFGIDEDDEPFAFMWTRDQSQDFVFSLSRQLEPSPSDTIEYMVLDQVWEPMSDFRCSVHRDCIRAEVPESLRKCTGGDDEIVVVHGKSGQEYTDLVAILKRIFAGKDGLTIDEE